MSALLELAERCEAASGPDRELDVAITCEAYKYLRAPDYILPAPSGGGRCVHYYLQSGTHGTSAAPRYTGSIETVLHHLLPDDADFFGIFYEALARCPVTDRFNSDFPRYLCAAALRARASA